MSGLTTQEYEQQAAACDDLCAVPVTQEQHQAGELPCVRCPFCKLVVTAILTKTTISCPECKTTVGL